VLPPPPLPSVGEEDDAHSMNTNSSPAMSAHAICWVLKDCALLDPPLLVGRTGRKTAKAMAATMMAMLVAAVES
jgi:hypothetical protein